MDKKAPKLRFKGFTDAWEQRKLGNIAPLRGGYAFESGSYKSLGVPVIRISNIQSNGIVGSTFCYYDKLEGDSNFTLYGGDILLAMSGATTGKVARISTNSHQKFYQNQRVGFFQHVDSTDYEFVYTLVQSENFKNQLLLVLATGAQPNVSSREIDNFEFKIPLNQNEQNKIGLLNLEIDNLITHHQRKLDSTKKLKAYFLQNMFPAAGESKPKIRFAGFTDDWEQRKLSEIVERVTRKNQNLESTLPLTISAQYGLIDQNEFFDKRIASKDVSGYYLIKNGEFAYNKSTSNDAPWGAIKRLDRYDAGVLSTLYIVFAIKNTNDVNSDYLVSYYETNLWHTGIQEIAAEGARNHGLLNIAPSDFFSTSLMIPKDVEEQKEIGCLFTKIDNLITLHQRKLEQLQNVKKFLLEKMFV